MCDLCTNRAAVWLFGSCLCGSCAWERLEGDGPEAEGFCDERRAFIRDLISLDDFGAIA